MDAAQQQQFLEYIAQYPDQEPLATFFARSAERETPTRFYAALPLGDVFLMPEFVVFLSRARGEAGWQQMWHKLKDNTVAQLKTIHLAYKAATNPGSLVFTGAKWLWNYFQDEDVIGQALVNPHSFLVPIQEIESIEAASKWSQGAYITLKTATSSFVICQSLDEETNNLVDIIKVFNGIRKGEWQPEFVSLIEEKIASRQTKAA